MKWPELVPKIKQLTRNQQCNAPSIILIHLGSNDLVNTPCHTLYRTVSSDLRLIHELFPRTVIIWSDILPRLFWYGARSIPAIEKARARVNRKGREVTLQVAGGRVIYHNEITHNSPALYRHDGVHLSDIGNDIFITTIQGALEKFVKHPSSLSPDSVIYM